MSETLYGIPKPIVHKAPVPKPQFTVTPAEQQVIRTVIETFLKALVAQDLKTIKRVSGDANLKLLEEKFTERVTSKPIYAYDLTNAQYKFTRDQKAGPVQVEVDGFEIEIDFGGQRQWRGARKTYRVIFVQGAPKLILNPTEK